MKQAAEDVFNKSEQELGNAFEDVKQNFQGGTGSTPPPYSGGRLKEDRSLVTYILLSLVTCGIYGYYFIYKLAEEVNIACEGDGEQTSGLVAFILLSFITCGIYAYYWYYKLGNRLAANAVRYNLNFQENGTTVLMWCIFGAFLCGIGQFVAMHILIKNSNMICAAYNRSKGLYLFTRKRICDKIRTTRKEGVVPRQKVRCRFRQYDLKESGIYGTN